MLRRFSQMPSSDNLMRDLGRNLNKLVQELKNAESPEATVYLRLLGNELGYLKTKEMEDMVNSATMMFDSMAKMFPTDVRKPATVSKGTAALQLIISTNKRSGCSCSCLWR